MDLVPLLMDATFNFIRGIPSESPADFIDISLSLSPTNIKRKNPKQDGALGLV